MFASKKKEKYFEKYIIENKEKIYKIAFMYVKNQHDAMDVVQEGIIKAYSKLDNLKDIEAMDKWVIRIIVNTALDLIRKNSKIVLKEDEVIEVLINDNTDNKVKSSFNEIIDSLDEELRGIITLKYFHGYKIKEVSEILNISESQIKNKIHKALNLLRKEIKGELQWGRIILKKKKMIMQI